MAISTKKSSYGSQPLPVYKGPSTRVRMHSFKMGDVDDLEVYIAQPIWEWQQTEKGKWCMKYGDDLRYSWQADHQSFGYHVVIDGLLQDEDLTFFLLKWNEK